MRAREFISEQIQMPPEQADPLHHTYAIPDLTSDNPYRTYRLGVAIARARSDAQQDDIDPFKEAWKTNAAMGHVAVISGAGATVDPIIDQALAMTDTPGGKELVSTPESTEPDLVYKQSPIRPFRGYPR